MWVMGEGASGYWIVGVTSFQKIYGTVADKRNVALHIHMGNIFNNLQY